MSNGMIETINCDISAIKRYDVDIQKNYILIARRLYDLKEARYLEKIDFKGYKNIYDLALCEFGYEVSKTRYLIAIYLRFFNSFETVTKNKVSTTGIKQDKYSEFSISQLRYMYEMDEEQLKKCKPEMTVREIKEIKSNCGTRVPDLSVDNSTMLKNQNVIEGFFPAKNQEEIEEQPEEKVTTIIVTELPKEERRENKTITIDVKTKQDGSFEMDSDDEIQDEFYKKQYYEALDKIAELEKSLKSKDKKINELIEKNDEQKGIVKYFYDELFLLSSKLDDDILQKIVSDYYAYINKNKLPEKVNFFKNVI